LSLENVGRSIAELKTIAKSAASIRFVLCGSVVRIFSLELLDQRALAVKEEMVEFNPPPRINNSGKPEPASS
jgi:hypothetical protein